MCRDSVPTADRHAAGVLSRQSAPVRAAPIRIGRTRKRDWLPAVVLACGGVVALACASLPAPVPGGEVVVITAPGTTFPATLAMVQRAGGALVAPGRFANVIVVRSFRPDFAEALHAQGAWAVIASPSLVGCVGVRKAGDATAGTIA